jgi:hypothetical protein
MENRGEGVWTGAAVPPGEYVLHFMAMKQNGRGETLGMAQGQAKVVVPEGIETVNAGELELKSAPAHPPQP